MTNLERAAVEPNDWASVLGFLCNEVWNPEDSGAFPFYEEVANDWVALSRLETPQEVFEGLTSIPPALAQWCGGDRWRSAVGALWYSIRALRPEHVAPVVEMALSQPQACQIGLSAFAKPESWGPINEWLSKGEALEEDLRFLKARINDHHPGRWAECPELAQRFRQFASDLFARFPKATAPLGQLHASVINEPYDWRRYEQ